MPVKFRRDLHRRLWIALSNPYWYEHCICCELAIKTVAHSNLIKYDPNFQRQTIYLTGNTYVCSITDTCLNCTMKSKCRNGQKNELSLMDKWRAMVNQIDADGKRRRLKQMHIFLACTYAQAIAFSELDDVAYDASLYEIIDDMAGKDETVQRILHN